MKKKTLVLLAITVLIINMSSIGILATNNPENVLPQQQQQQQQNPANVLPQQQQQQQQDPANVPPQQQDGSVNNTEALTDNIPSENTSNEETVPQVLSSITVNETDIVRDNRIILSNLLNSEYVAQFMTQKNYPFVIDLTSFDSQIDSVLIPEGLLGVLIVEEQPTIDVENADNTTQTTPVTVPGTENVTTNTTTEQPVNPENNVPPANTNIPVTGHTDGFILKVILKNAEYSWKKDSLKNAEIINGFLKINLESADQIQLKVDDEGQEIPRGKLDLEFSPKDDDNRGVLIVSKDDAGYWNITSAYLFGSFVTYLIPIVIMILLIFALIIAVNLIIIKIYRTKK